MARANITALITVADHVCGRKGNSLVHEVLHDLNIIFPRIANMVPFGNMNTFTTTAQSPRTRRGRRWLYETILKGLQQRRKRNS